MKRESENYCITQSFDDCSDSDTIFLTNEMFNNFFQVDTFTRPSNEPNVENRSTDSLVQSSFNNTFSHMKILVKRLVGIPKWLTYTLSYQKLEV